MYIDIDIKVCIQCGYPEHPLVARYVGCCCQCVAECVEVDALTELISYCRCFIYRPLVSYHERRCCLHLLRTQIQFYPSHHFQQRRSYPLKQITKFQPSYPLTTPASAYQTLLSPMTQSLFIGIISYQHRVISGSPQLINSELHSFRSRSSRRHVTQFY